MAKKKKKVSITLDGETLTQLKKAAALADTSVNTVACVILAIEMLKTKAERKK